MSKARDSRAAIGRPFSRRMLRTGILLLAFCIAVCQVYYYHERSLPRISGVVLDMQTGKPIAGAEVGVTYLGPMESLAAPAAPIPVGGGGTGKTDQQGRFSFRAAKLPVGSPLYFLFGPNEVTGIWLVVYSRDYVTCLSYSPGLDWNRDERLAPFRGLSLEREGSRWKGFRYTIRVTRPESEEQWQEKTSLTLSAASSLPQVLADQWRFDDLTSYLKRWPQGKMAVKYFSFLLPTAMLASCEYTRDQYLSGKWTTQDLRTSIERMQVILQLSEVVDRSREDAICEKLEEKDISEIPEYIRCRQALLTDQIGLKGGKR